MAIPSSGPISMSMFNTEFGLGNSLSAYRGKGNVPASGPISFSQLYGAISTIPPVEVAASGMIDIGFGTICYDRRKRPDGSAYGSAGTLSAQPFDGKSLVYFGTDVYPRVTFMFEGDTRSDPFLNNKKILIDGVEVAFGAGVYDDGTSIGVRPFTYYTSGNRPSGFANGSTHRIAFTNGDSYSTSAPVYTWEVQPNLGGTAGRLLVINWESPLDPYSSPNGENSVANIGGDANTSITWFGQARHQKIQFWYYFNDSALINSLTKVNIFGVNYYRGSLKSGSYNATTAVYGVSKT